MLHQVMTFNHMTKCPEECSVQMTEVFYKYTHAALENMQVHCPKCSTNTNR